VKLRAGPWVAALAALSGCAPRPARFADAPVIQEIADDAPIPVPRPLDPIPEIVVSEAYLRRPVIEALDPSRRPDAGDVNALDEVPRSRWFSPEGAPRAARDEDPPAPPFRLLDVPAVTHEGGLVVLDARGIRFELWRDPDGRPGMATAAAVAASRILRAVGYYTPGTWATGLTWSDFVVRDTSQHDAVRAFFRRGPHSDDGVFRAGVTRWPIGADLGPTPALSVRGDDPNDRVPHEDRRTVRALKVFFAWLGITHLGPDLLRDAYVGAPGRGHVVHYLAGLHGALGADAVTQPRKPAEDDSDLIHDNPWRTLATLGIAHPADPPTQTRWLSIGAYDERVAPAAFRTSPPFAPMDRLLPADAYWAAKQLAAIPPAVIDQALDAAQIADATARARLVEVIRARRIALLRWGFDRVTACEVERVEQAGGARRPARLVLRDEAALRGLSTSPRHRVDLLDEQGRGIAPPQTIAPGGALFAVELPESAPAYLVVRVTAERAWQGDPRAFEAHLVRRGGAWAVVGIVH
jgi:hypothetical protein